MTVRRLREWPRVIAGSLAVAIVLVGLGLLIGAETLGSTTTTTTTTIARPAAAARAPNPTRVQAASLATQRKHVATLKRELTIAHTRLASVRRQLRANQRRAASTRAHAHHAAAPHHKRKTTKSRR